MIDDLAVFARVAQFGSFTRAARELGMPKSTVSRKIAKLEERLGAALVSRTTRKLRLTDAGRACFAHAERVVHEAEAAELAVTDMLAAPRGVLRVTAPLKFDFLGPINAGFLLKYPDVRVELTCTDRVVDLVGEGFHVGVRAGKLADSSLVQRPLGSLRSYLLAAPKLIERDVPKRPEDLKRFPCLAFNAPRFSLEGKRRVTIEFEPRLLSNDMDVLLDAAIAGVGIVMLPVHLAAEATKKKKLVRVLPDWCSTPVPVQLVYPSARLVAPTLKAYVEHLRAHMTPAPWGP